MAEEKKNIVGFKKFSDMKSKSKIEEVDPSLDTQPATDSDLPGNPNLPKKTKKVERAASRKKVIPEDQKIVPEDNEMTDADTIKIKGEKTHESNVATFGKVAKFPKNTKASKAYNFLENIKCPKKSIWYIMVERQDNELQMVKYNYKEGVDLYRFVNELKSYYIKKYSTDKKITEAISAIDIDGNDKYSAIKNVPRIELDGKKLITKITEDLIKLLSK